MLKFIRARKDYKKCHKVLMSCSDMEQLKTASYMVFNYYNMYGSNDKWFKLTTLKFSMYKKLTDIIDYEKRKKDIL